MQSTMNQRNQLLISAAILITVMVAGVIVHYNVFTRPFPGHNDFLTPWEASRSYFYDGLDPYSDEVSVIIQEQIYGRPALPGEFLNNYAYPFYTTYFVWPTIHLEYAWATAIWMVVSEAALIGALFLLFSLFDWKPEPLTVGGLVLFTLMSYPGARGLILGQVSHVVYFTQVLALWAMFKDREGIAGVALAISTFKPQMGTLFVPLLLLWGLYNHRWQFLVYFGVVFGALVGSSFVLLPGWLDGMLYQIRLYPSYIEVSTPAWVATQYLFGLGNVAEWIVNGLFYGFMLWTWFALFVQNQRERLLWTALITLTVMHLVAFRTATPHFVIFTIPLVFYLKQYAHRYPWRTLMVMLMLLVLPWVHFLTTIDATEFEHPTMFLPIPLLTFASLWFTRRLWWERGPQLTHPQDASSHEEASAQSFAGQPSQSSK